MSHTYAILEVSPAAFEEIEQKLRNAGYHHVFDTDGFDTDGRMVVIDMHGIALKREGVLVEREDAQRKQTALKKALAQAHLLLQTVSIRTAPQSLKELGQSSNMTSRNAAYLHPDVLLRFAMDATPGVRLVNVLGSLSLIVCTPLLPPFGVIYGPLYDLFLSEEQKAEDFEQHWNVAKLHRPAVRAVKLNESPCSAVFKFNDTEMLHTISQATEFYNLYEFQPVPPVRKSLDEDILPVRSKLFKLSGKDSEGRYIYLPAD
jgi:hypothetical protein